MLGWGAVGFARSAKTAAAGGSGVGGERVSDRRQARGRVAVALGLRENAQRSDAKAGATMVGEARSGTANSRAGTGLRLSFGTRGGATESRHRQESLHPTQKAWLLLRAATLSEKRRTA